MSQPLTIHLPKPGVDFIALVSDEGFWEDLRRIPADRVLHLVTDLSDTQDAVDAVNAVFRRLVQIVAERGLTVRIETVFSKPETTQTERALAASLATAFAPHEEDKLIVNISYQCNNHCRFCAVADRPRLDGSLDAQRDALRKAREAGVRLLDIDGGEPTLCGHLETLLDEALALGYERINLTTNGRNLSDERRVARLARYPIQWLVSLHGSTPALHDDLVSVPGAFRQTVKGILNLRRNFPNVGLNTTITAQNVDDLPRLAALVDKLGARPWNVQIYTPFGRPNAALAVEPSRLRDALKPLLESWGERLAVQIVNAPFCLLPGLERYGARDFYKSARAMLFVDGRDVNLADYLAERRFKNGLCLHCPHDAVCGGFWDYGENRDTGERYRVRLLDVIPGYACDARCVFCAVDDAVLSDNRTTQAVKEAMREAMSLGPTSLRLGGGEPTLRKDFPELLREAQRLGFSEIGVQSHGFRFADEAFLRRAVEAGMTKLNLSTRGADAELHHRLTGTKDTFAKLCRAVTQAAGVEGLRLEMDLIVLRDTMAQLSQEIRFFYGLGARNFNLWFAGIEGRLAGNPGGRVPRLSEAAPFVEEALSLESGLPGVQIRSYYMPYCFLKGREEQVWHPLAENALVLTPNAAFRLDRSTIEIGIFPAPCQACALQDRCFGINPNYVDHYGYEELQPYATLPGRDEGTAHGRDDETDF